MKAPSPHSGLSKIDSQSFFEMNPTIALLFQFWTQYFVFIRPITESNHCQKVKWRFGRFSRLNIFHVTTLCKLKWLPRNNLWPKNNIACSERSKFDWIFFLHIIFSVAKSWPQEAWSGTLKGIRVDSEKALSQRMEAVALASWSGFRNFMLVMNYLSDARCAKIGTSHPAQKLNHDLDFSRAWNFQEGFRFYNYRSLTLTRQLRKKLRISAGSLLIWQK